MSLSPRRRIVSHVDNRCCCVMVTLTNCNCEQVTVRSPFPPGRRVVSYQMSPEVIAGDECIWVASTSVTTVRFSGPLVAGPSDAKDTQGPAVCRCGRFLLLTYFCLCRQRLSDFAGEPLEYIGPEPPPRGCTIPYASAQELWARSVSPLHKEEMRQKALRASSHCHSLSLYR